MDQIFGTHPLTPTQWEPPSSGGLIDLFLPLAVTPITTNVIARTAAHSYYNTPINRLPDRLSGYSRNYGHAPSAVQAAVMEQILQKSSDLSRDDRALLLAIARVESGFNPDAAATTTSASGIFQFVRTTGAEYGLIDENRFSAKDNIEAGLRFFKDNARLVQNRWPHLRGDERAIMLYALHHDGPSLAYGGAEIAREEVIPMLPRFRCLVDDYLARAATTSSTSYG